MDELLTLPDTVTVTRLSFRLMTAAVLGALIGIEREWRGKAAGLRTHTTVALAAAAFVLAVLESGADGDSLSRAIQGIAAGIGFIGAGTILKKTNEEDIQGLTTAATIWLTAAIGVAAGAGKMTLAVLCVACALIVLRVFDGVGRWLEKRI